MMNKILLISIFMIFLSASVFAQESKYERHIRFDADKYKERQKIAKIIAADSIKKIINTQLADYGKYSIRIYDVQEIASAKMPKMSSTKDFHYTLEIKKYSSNHIPVQLDSLLKK